MSKYVSLRRSELLDVLLHKGIVAKKLNKSELITLLNNFDNGNLQIDTSNLEHNLEIELNALKEHIKELEDDLSDKSIHLNRTKDNSELFKTLALEAEEALNGKLEEQSKVIDDLKSQIAANNVNTNFDFSCDNCSSYIETIAELDKSIQVQTLELSCQIKEINELRQKISSFQQPCPLKLLNNATPRAQEQQC